MAVDVEYHIARYRAMARKREQYLTDWQDIASQTRIDAQDITHESLPGNLRHERFDNTGMEACGIFQASVQGGLTNPALDWQRMKFRNDELNKQPGVADWLEEVSKQTLWAYASSNFYVSSHTFYGNYADFGTACMYEEERQDYNELFFFPGLSFRTIYPSRFVCEENAQGRIDTVYREFTLTPRQAMQQFGEEGLPNAVRRMALEPSSTDKPRVYLQCTYPRAEYRRGDPRPGNRNMPYASCYIDYEARQCMRERGYEEFPYFVARFSKQHDETPWGVGPGHVALPAMRSLDRLCEMELEGAALHLQPPLNVIENGVVGQLSQISLQSLAINVVRRPDAITPLQLTTGADKTIIEIDRQRLEGAIRRAYYADQLEMLLRPPETQMTATEFVQRLRVLERLLGPAFFRLTYEFLDPLADRTFGILSRAGILPQPPLPVVMAAYENQGQLDVEYVGPLARAQRAGDVEAITKWYAVGAQIAEATQNPAVLQVMNHEKALRHAADVEGVPAHLLRTPQELEELQAAQAEQQAAALEAAQFEQQAGGIGKLAPMVEALKGPQEIGRAYV